MRPERGPGAGVFDKEIFVRVVGKIGAVAFFAIAREAFDAKVVVGFRGQGALAGAGFEQALGDGDAGGHTECFHFGHCSGGKTADVGLPGLIEREVFGIEFDVFDLGDGAEVELCGGGDSDGIDALASAGDGGEADAGLLIADECYWRLDAHLAQGRPVLPEKQPYADECSNAEKHLYAEAAGFECVDVIFYCGGTRYIEQMLGKFGVRISDARAHRSEFIGSTSSYINFSEVLQTSQTDTTPLYRDW